MPDPLVAELTTGRVRGAESGGVRRWLGIPYAEAPTGALRFAPPQPAPAWTGVRDALGHGPPAPQADPWRSRRMLAGSGEACLTVDVRAPAGPAAGPLPVLVWVHGGSFNSGRLQITDPAALVREGGIVVVSVAYRLGALGFVDFAGALGGDPRITTNAGLRDVLAALRWVQREAAAFGGDPRAVTLGGVSAGGAIVSLLMAQAHREGLVHRAIVHSGPPTFTAEAEDAKRAAGELLQRVGAADAEALLRLPASELVLAAGALQRELRGALLTRPWWDGDLLAATPAGVAAPAPPIPLLIGTTLHEHRLFRRLRSPVLPLTRAALAATLEGTAGAAHAARILGRYPATAEGNDALGSDLIFRMPSIHLAARHAARGPVWMFRFDHRARFGFGAAHALDTAVLFAMLPRPLKPLAGARGVVTPLAARMRAHWTRFVRSGEPDASWPRYEVGERATLLFGARDRVEADPDAARREAWAGHDTIVRWPRT